MKKRNRRATFTFLLVLATLFSSTLLHADVTGSILGVAHDRSQAVVAGARVVVTNVQTNFTQEATSAADGSFRFLALPVGTYKLTATFRRIQPVHCDGHRLESKRPVAH